MALTFADEVVGGRWTTAKANAIYQALEDLAAVVLASKCRIVNELGPYATLQAALAAAESGDVVVLPPGVYSGSLDEAIVVPDGVSIQGYGATVSKIVMPSGEPSVPTIVFEGNNNVSRVGIYSQTGSDSTDGGIQLRGANHNFDHCIIDGNQDLVTLGSTTLGEEWEGGTVFRECEFTGWSFDLLRANGTLSTGQQDIRFINCRMVGTTAARRVIIGGANCPMRCDLIGCVIDGNSGADAGNFSIVGGGGADGYLTYKPVIASTSVAAAVNTGLSALTKSNEWANYTFRPGDFFRVTSGGTVGDYPVYQKTSDGEINVVGDVGAASVDGTLYPGYVYTFRDCVIRTNSKCTNEALFSHSGSANPSAPNTAGCRVVVDNCRIDGPTGMVLVKAGTLNHTAVTNQPTLEINNTRLPSGYSITTSTVNVANRAKLAFRGTTLRETYLTLTDGATITVDPNLGATQVVTGIAGNRTLAANANGSGYFVGQEFEILLSSDGTGRTVTPDGTTIKGEAISVHATSTVVVSARYRYTGSYWVQVGAVQEVGY